MEGTSSNHRNDPVKVKSSDNRSGAHRTKRLKIDVACETCRAKKVRCDGVRPVCGYCSRKLDLRQTCRFSTNEASHRNASTARAHHASPTRPIASNGPVSSPLISPPHNLSTSTRSPGARQPGPTSQAYRLSHAPSAEARAAAISNPTSTPGSNIHRPDSSLTGNQSQDKSPTIIDSMTTVVDEGTSTREVFGKSSAGSFTSEIKRAIDLRFGNQLHGPAQQTDRDSLPGVSWAVSAASTAPRRPDPTYVLPPRRQADHLLEQYWFYVDPLYPFLDRTQWQSSYEAVFAGTPLQVDERLFVATLNIVLALSTQLVETLSQEAREENSNEYLRRAQELQPFHQLDTLSLELAQYLLLVSQFLQSTDQPHQTWMAVGSAIRIAQGLGMHVDDTSASTEQSNGRDLMRRVWYGCVLMDRMVSMTHGRPPMISEHLATVVTEPELPASLQANDIDRVTFFVMSVRLYEITNRIIDELYNSKGTGQDSSTQNSTPGGRLRSPPAEPNDDDLDTVVRLDRCLNRWNTQVPSHLTWDNQSNMSHAIHRRQTVILHMRYLHARMLLLRPVLCRFCLPETPIQGPQLSASLQVRLIEQGALLCVSTAQETIAAAAQHQTYDGSIGLLPAWWYRVYYVYTAATILIAARLRPKSFPVAGLAHSWGQAVATLKAHEKFRPSVRKCVAALHILSCKVLQPAPDGAVAVPSAPVSRRPSRGAAEAVAANAVEGLGGVDAVQAELEAVMDPMDGFGVSGEELDGLHVSDFSFEVNDMSWLHDMHTAWELLN